MIARLDGAMCRQRVAKALWSCYPPIVTRRARPTANHWWFDAALGAVVAAAPRRAPPRFAVPARAWAWIPARPAPA